MGMNTRMMGSFDQCWKPAIIIIFLNLLNSKELRMLIERKHQALYSFIQNSDFVIWQNGLIKQPLLFILLFLWL